MRKLILSLLVVAGITIANASEEKEAAPTTTTMTSVKVPEKTNDAEKDTNKSGDQTHAKSKTNEKKEGKCTLL